MATKVRWRNAPLEKDYEAATRYLSLVLGPRRASTVTRALRAAPIERHVGRDLMRAAGYGPSAYDDKSQRKEIEKGRSLAPVLIVRNARDARVIIADGYHRLGAVCELDPECQVPCKVV